MASFKSLAKDTAIYGMSSIVGRFLNWLLVPLYTAKISAASGGYGVITNVYSYVALLMVILTFGMETAFFNFSTKGDDRPDTVYSTSLISVGGVSMAFFAIVMLWLNPIASLMGYADHAYFIATMAAVVALDAFQAIIFARFRYEKRPLRFAALKLLFIVLNIGLNLLYFVLLPDWVVKYPALLAIYNPSIGVGYAFILNLVCTSIVMLIMMKDLAKIKWQWDSALMRRMLGYAWPILVLGVAGILNQTVDKILFPYISTDANATAELGIYGASVKIAMIMAMITQAFRYAYEPFVFANRNESESRSTYAKGMKYFLVFTLLAYLAVVMYIDILKHIIAPDYWVGLRVVPIVMAAEIMMGVYFNLSFWYKLTNRTIWGAVFSGAGCAVLVAVNVLFVPRYSYMACAWAGVAGYGTAMILSYLVGRKYYPVPYEIGRMMVYVALCAALHALSLISFGTLWLDMPYRTLLIAVFVAAVPETRNILSSLLARLGYHVNSHKN